MPLVTPITGDVLLLRYMVNFSSPSNAELRLFNNNYTPSETDVIGTFTESAASNYTATALVGTSWTVSSGSPNGATATYAQQSFNFSAADTIYGYFVTQAGKTLLLWQERFQGGPFVLPSSGGTISVTPRISLD